MAQAFAPTAAASPRKRKLDDALAVLQLSSRPPSELGPVIASFASADPPPDIPFQCYYNSPLAASKKDEKDFVDHDILVAGQSKDVDFWTRLSVHDATGGHARYLVGLRSRASNTLTLRDAPVHFITRDVKRLKHINADVSGPSAEKTTQRASLTRAFGTKKSLRAVRVRERNEVNVASMVGVLEHLNEGVEEKTGSLPSVDHAKEILDSSRLIPRFNQNADKPEDPLQSEAGDLARVKKLLPFSRSKYINGHLQALCHNPLPSETHKRSVQLLVYMSSLFFLRFSQRSLDRDVLNERLKTLPQAAIDGLVGRFTATARGSYRLQMTSEKETLLLTTLLACCLHLDNFIVDVSTIAQDLSLGTPRVHELFKSLGCRIEVPNAGDCARLGVSDGALGGRNVQY